MIEKILAFLVHFVTGVIDSGGYAGIVALMGIESACIPLPSEIIMPFAGYTVYLGHMSLVWVATAGAVGCNLGSVVAYWIGAYGGRPMVERFGRYVLLNEHDLDRVTHYFEKYGGITPVGLRAGWPILIDLNVVDQERVIIGSGIRGSKLLAATEVLASLSNAQVLAITKPIA